MGRPSLPVGAEEEGMWQPATRSIRGDIKNHYYGLFTAFTLRPIEGAPETQPARLAISRIGKTYTLLKELHGSQ